MKKVKSKNILIMVLAALLIPTISLGYKYQVDTRTMVADSGFDSSYSSGGSSHSSSGSSSSSSSRSSSRSSRSSSSSNDRSSSTSSSSGEYSILDYILAAMLIIFLVVIPTFLLIASTIDTIASHFRLKRYIKKVNNLDNINEINEENFNKFEKATIADFKKDRYDDYVSIQEGWMNFDYDMLRSKLTDELYNQYEMQLETLKVKNQKNIMKDFEYKNSKIVELVEQNNELIATMRLAVWQIDYIEENGKAVRGSISRKNKMIYELTFVKRKSDITKCPKCGAKIIKKVSHKCEHCQTFINMDSDNWVLSKKKAIRQE